MNQSSKKENDKLLVAAGTVARGVAFELLQPLRGLRDSLAVIVEALDRHVSEARGPTPYPWPQTKALREQMAEAYLMSRTVTRLTAYLATAIDAPGSVPEDVEIGELVEAAVSLTRHRISVDTELFIDLGSTPTARAVPGGLILLLSKILSLAADSARGGSEGSAISIKTRREQTPEGDVLVAYIADNGAGVPEDVEGAAELAALVLDPLDGSFDLTSESGAGSVFELRLPVKR